MEKGAISVSRAELGDVADLLAILNGATQYKVERGDMAWGSEARSEQRVRDAMAESQMYIVRQDGRSVGTTCLQWDDEHYWGKQQPIAGYIHGLAVESSVHGQGIGAMVIEWARHQAFLQGRQFLRLDCSARNAGLCRYYERQGFIQVGQRVLQSGYIAALYQCEASHC